MAKPIPQSHAMHFKIVYGNHYNFGLAPSHTFLMLKHGLEDLGHRADIEKDFQPGYPNILIENFTDDHVDAMLAVWTPGTGLIVIATEILTGDTFNDFASPTGPEGSGPVRDARLDHYRNQDYLKPRFAAFMRIAPRADAVWHLAHQQVATYRRLLPDVPVGYLAHGYTAGCASVRHRPEADKDIDVFFSGARTHYREAILEDLSGAGLRVAHTHQMTAPFHRDDLVARARVCLNIRQDADWPYESNSRLYFHLVNDSVIVTEPCPEPSDLHGYVPEIVSPLVGFLREQLALGRFTERAAALRERFADDRPMSGVLAPLLREIGYD